MEDVGVVSCRCLGCGYEQTLDFSSEVRPLGGDVVRMRRSWGRGGADDVADAADAGVTGTVSGMIWCCAEGWW